MAKQFGLEQRLGDGRAVKGYKGLGGTGAEVVQAAGHPLLATAGFTADQHVHRQAGQVQHLPAQLLQALGHAQQRAFQA
ncbi:hypothetical protein D3C75_1049060 [compost metagenome]